MEPLRKNTTHILRFQGYTAAGMGVARLEGRVVFVPGVISGELWEVLLVKVSKNVIWGKGVKLVITEDSRLNITCNINVAYGQTVVAVAQAVQESVVSAVESMTGLQVSNVDVNVCGIAQKEAE